MTITPFALVEFICLLVALGGVFLLIRNQWVFRVRLRLLRGDFDAYMRLPDYQTMMRRFWLWRVEDFTGPRP